MRRKLTWTILGLALMVLSVYILNLFCIPAHDELRYAYVYDQYHISSFADIVRQQVHDYVNFNCRIFVHTIVAFFSGFHLNYLFDVVNTAVWFLFVWLVLREGNVRIRNLGTYLLGAAIVWWFYWWAQTCCTNAAFAVNYLWAAAATVAMMMAWRNLRPWMLPFAFLYGWSQEVHVLPMLAALAGGAVLRSLLERRVALTGRQAMAWVLMLAGACFLCFGPAALSRAGAALSMDEVRRMQILVRYLGSLVLSGGPTLLFIGLVIVLWRGRGELRALILRSAEWWCFLVAAFSFFCIVSINAEARIFSPTLVAAIILLLRERADFAWIGPKTRNTFAVIVVLSMVVAAGFQVSFGLNAFRMLRLYEADPQGVTFFRAMPSFPFFYATDREAYSRYHRPFFGLEANRKEEFIVLSPWLYENFYKNPDAFFAEAKELGNSGLFVAEKAHKVAIKRGTEPLTDEQEAILDAYGEAEFAKPKGWRRHLPGRFTVLFPKEDDRYLGLPSKRVPIRCADGKEYLLALPWVQEKLQ